MTNSQIPKIGDIVRIRDEKGNEHQEVVVSVEYPVDGRIAFHFNEGGNVERHHYYILNKDELTWKHSGASCNDPRMTSTVTIIGHMNNAIYF